MHVVLVPRLWSQEEGQADSWASCGLQGDTQLSRTPPSDHVLAQTLAQRRIVYVTLCQGVKGSIP